MAADNQYLRILINGRSVQVEDAEDLPISISYELEEPGNFQEKSASTALNITFPATLDNDQVFNTFHNPGIEDMTPGKVYENMMPVSINIGGTELFKGQALLESATSTDLPEEYTVDMYGNNGDWALPMKDLTLADVLPNITHTFTKANIEASWWYDGRTAEQFYVYAPVRYRKPFNDNDTNVRVEDMRPALFIALMIKKAFSMFKYRLVSNFFETDYFRRLVMPWVWGDFMNINNKLSDLLKFRATGPKYNGSVFTNRVYDFILNSGGATNDSDTVTSDGTATGFDMSNDFEDQGYDNGNVYQFHGNGSPYNASMEWRYIPEVANQLGTVTARFTVKTYGYISARNNSYVNLFIDVYKSGSLNQHILIATVSGPTVGLAENDFASSPITTNFEVSGMNTWDNVVIRYTYEYFKSGTGSIRVTVYSTLPPPVNTNTPRYTSFELAGIRIEPGGIVNFQQYDKLRSYKFLDMFRGIIDAFSLEPTTDSTNRTVYFEPTHPYYLNNDFYNKTDGHYVTNRLNWTGKQDVSKQSQLSLFKDLEREFMFAFKEDGSDGGMNKYALRYSVNPGSSLYLFPNRFKSGRKEFTNRFFSACMHYEAQQWKNITGVAPQLIAMIPENVSNTSSDVAESAFTPKLAWYKGMVSRNTYGGWVWEGANWYDLPYMFAVNYKAGGENDPVLTYCDQHIGEVVAHGLLKRFFLKRMAVMRKGRLLTTHIDLNLNDVCNWRHREPIIINGHAYLLISIDEYKPLKDESTKCQLWLDAPITREDVNSCFPSTATVANEPNEVSSGDLKYKKLLLLTTDIPK